MSQAFLYVHFLPVNYDVLNTAADPDVRSIFTHKDKPKGSSVGDDMMKRADAGILSTESVSDHDQAEVDIMLPSMDDHVNGRTAVKGHDQKQADDKVPSFDDVFQHINFIYNYEAQYLGFGSYEDRDANSNTDATSAAGDRGEYKYEHSQSKHKHEL